MRTTASVCCSTGICSATVCIRWRALADGVEFAASTFTVSTLGLGAFATGLGGEYPLADFPGAGQETTVEWEESLQNFVITGVGATEATE